ncbi:hypothetical protein L1987_80870 [Smallanthus sonchifolius]|uniref:Uncharacterized protein n=1 Tax=Smallanthus sonchifolius TaxID=185202 RepID=A0ACB8YPI0_9ASTR|nr:hypothetical protein L1987_80870 [Smallanthus sonchifolius]
MDSWLYDGCIKGCGMRLKSDDPLTMKNFIVSIQNKVTELKAASGDSQGNTRSKRMEFMLETIFDIKNNKKKAKEDTLQHTVIKNWSQKLRAESIFVQGLKWSKLLDPEKKRSLVVFGRESSEAQKMHQLAAGQRMNTYPRRAIFCIIIYAEDYIDAFEKLLRLNLQGKQFRYASLYPSCLCLFNTETGTALRELIFLTSILDVCVNRKKADSDTVPNLKGLCIFSIFGWLLFSCSSKHHKRRDAHRSPLGAIVFSSNGMCIATSEHGTINRVHSGRIRVTDQTG